MNHPTLVVTGVAKDRLQGRFFAYSLRWPTPHHFVVSPTTILLKER